MFIRDSASFDDFALVYNLRAYMERLNARGCEEYQYTVGLLYIFGA